MIADITFWPACLYVVSMFFALIAVIALARLLQIAFSEYGAYKKFRIDHRTGGGYWLFGFNEKQRRWLLLEQTLFIDEAERWAIHCKTLMPVEIEPTPATEILDEV